MALSLLTLPAEILNQIMDSLTVPSLLAFSATNKFGQTLALDALKSLDLAVLPRRLHTTIAFMNQSQNNHSSLHQIGKTTALEFSASSDKKDTNTQQIPTCDEQIAAQNKIANEILRKPNLRDLRSLTLQLYDLSSSDLSSAIASKLSNLRDLEFRFNHSHVHDKSLPGLFWREPGRGTPAWNAFAGIGEENARNLRLHGLQSLSIERGSLTSVQLRRFVEANPRLQKLYLNNVRGVDKDFVQWLGKRCSQPDSRLEEITLENCSQLALTREADFHWMSRLSENESLRRISLLKCRNVRDDILTRIMNDDEYEDWNLDEIEVFIPPKGPARHFGVIPEPKSKTAAPLMLTCAATGALTMRAATIEVDPAYISLPVAAAA